MSTSSPVVNERLTWDNFPIQEVFAGQDAYWMKVNPTYIVRVRWQEGAWDAYDEAVECRPSSSHRFSRVYINDPEEYERVIEKFARVKLFETTLKTVFYIAVTVLIAWLIR